jgi:endonuclease YncB( thermonuclease family)
MIELTVEGTLELNQFWPQGTSDADTTKLIVTPNRFLIRSAPGGTSRETHVFDGAKVKGRGGSKPVLNNAGKLTIRLQGIDAPELHYQAPPLPRSSAVTAAIRARYNDINADFRQHLGESATVALANHLNAAGTATLPCAAVTNVEKPNDVFDTYGRFVGDVHVTIGGQDENLNRWLAENGWAYPAFYNSMTPDEINLIRGLGDAARANHAPVWKHFTKKVGPFDRSLVFRGKGAVPDPAADKGPLIMPKLFRRLAAWTVAKKAGVPGTPTTFRKQLEKNALADAFFITDDFIANSTLSATPHGFPEFLDAASKFGLRPDEMVFREASSTLVGANGNLVTEWD